MRTKWPIVVCCLVGLQRAAVAQSTPVPSPSADESGTAIQPDSSAAIRDVRREVPILAYTYTAYGSSKGTIGAQAYTLGLVAADQEGVVGGGGAVWAAPLERLTLVVDAQRNVSKSFSPSATAMVRLYGNGRAGLSLGALGKFKVDGFAAGPNHDEMESELEAGALLSYIEAGWYVDANAIGGMGLGDDGEADAEGRLRLGRDLGQNVRVGLDGQARLRLSGPRSLPNGRSWDFAAGPQVMAGFGNFFVSTTAGPSTVGLLSKAVGWTAMLAVGGTTF
jgi:hypothetical protein